MEHLSVLQSKGILKSANSYILTNRERKELIDSFQNLSNLAKINKATFDPNSFKDQESIKLISKRLTLKDMIRLSVTNKKTREIMMPIIEAKRQELEELRIWLIGLPRSQNYTIKQLDQLTVLRLDNNQLTELPDPIYNLPNLQQLYLYDNQLKELPNLYFPNLIIFDLENNQLIKLPKFNLPNLERLSLSNNQLIEIPRFNLPNLQRLYLSNNQLTEIPTLSLSNLPNLQYLNLHNNPLSEIEKDRLKSVYGNSIYLEFEYDDDDDD